MSLTQMAWTFLKIGALGFGGPFSLLAIMQKELVERRHWLTEEEFTQSIGIGTTTPGPIFFAAAIFIGYRLRGIRGAMVAGLGILLPSFILVVVIAALYVQVQQNAWVVAFTQGLTAGVVGLFLTVVLTIGRTAGKDALGAAWIVIAFAVVAFFKTDPLLLIILAGLGGAVLLRPAPKIQEAEK